MKVQLNLYSDAAGHETYGPAYDLSVPGQEDALARSTESLVTSLASEIWFYTVEAPSSDIWDETFDQVVNREYGVCYTCSRDIAREGVEPWYHMDANVTLNHNAQPKRAPKPTIIPNNEMEKLFIKYFHHLKAMGTDTFLEYHHHYNSSVEFTDEEWAKLQELDVDAIIKE